MKKEGIGAENFRKKLDAGIKAEILEISKTSNQETPRNNATRTKSLRKSKILHLESMAISAKPPLLDEDIINKSIQNSNLYPMIYILENSIRKLITHYMQKNYGSNWWEDKINNTTKQNVENKKKKEKLNPWIGKRSDDPIYYTDFIDLVNILRSKPDIFNPIFTGLSGGINWITQRIEELYLIRNNLAHSCPLLKKDQDLLRAYFKTIYDTLDNLNVQIK